MLPMTIRKRFEFRVNPDISIFFATRRTKSRFAGMRDFTIKITIGAKSGVETKEKSSAN